MHRVAQQHLGLLDDWYFRDLRVLKNAILYCDQPVMNRLSHVLLHVDPLFRVRLAQLLEVVKVTPDQVRAADTLPHNLALDERFSHYAFKFD